MWEKGKEEREWEKKRKEGKKEGLFMGFIQTEGKREAVGMDGM